MDFVKSHPYMLMVILSVMAMLILSGCQTDEVDILEEPIVVEDAPIIINGVNKLCEGTYCVCFNNVELVPCDEENK